MRRLLLAMTLCLITALPAQARELPQAKLLAVYVYADWCPNCKILSPLVTQARAAGKLDDQAVLFVTFDLTNKTRIHQSVMLAQALGIGDFLKAQGSATGYLALLDATNKKEIARFDRTSTAAQIQQGITHALAR